MAALQQPGFDCNEIPGADEREYTLRPADGTRQMRVLVTGVNGSGAAPAALGRVLRRRVRPGGDRPAAPARRAGRAGEVAGAVAHRQALRRPDPRGLRRRLGRPDDRLPAPLGALRRERRRLHVHPEAREHGPRGRPDVHRPRGQRRLADPHAGHRGRQQRPHARRPGQPSAARRRGRHAADRGVTTGRPAAAAAPGRRQPARHGRAGGRRARRREEEGRRRQGRDRALPDVRGRHGPRRRRAQDERAQGQGPLPAEDAQEPQAQEVRVLQDRSRP